MLKTKPKYLLLVASFVWLIAGFNVLRLGILACLEQPLAPWIIALGIAVVFLLFHPMFSSLVGKHSERIRNYEPTNVHVYKFFDLKGYVMMAIMMGGGIALRSFSIIPTWFVAFFYTAVGAALMLAGVGFALHYFMRGQYLTCPVTGKSRLM